MAFYAHSSLEVQGVGDLISITDNSFDIGNDAQEETTMKSAGAGFSFGQVKITGSFTVKFSTSPEIDWIKMVRTKQITAFTHKLPDGTRIPVSVAPKQCSFKDQEVGAATIAVSYVGFTPQTQ